MKHLEPRQPDKFNFLTSMEICIMFHIKSIERETENFAQDLSIYNIYKFITTHSLTEGRGVSSAQSSPQVLICNGHRIHNFSINCCHPTQLRPFFL